MHVPRDGVSPSNRQLFVPDDSSNPRPLSRKNSCEESSRPEKRASDVALDCLHEHDDVVKRHASENARQFTKHAEKASAPSSPRKRSGASAPPPTPRKLSAAVSKYLLSPASQPDQVETVSRRSLWSPSAQKGAHPDYSPRSKSRFFLLNQKAMEEGSIEINKHTVTLTPFSEEGSYMRVYTLDADRNVISEVYNDTLVVKIYHGAKNKCFAESVNQKYLQNSMNNYFATISQGLPVACILNHQTVFTDRFILQEKIPHKIDINDPRQIEQVKNFFHISLKHGLILDLLDTNLRRREDGTVVLIDFVEEPENGLADFIGHAIRSWCQLFAQENEMDRGKTEIFLDNFTKGFGEYPFMTKKELAGIKERVIKGMFLEVQIEAFH